MGIFPCGHICLWGYYCADISCEDFLCHRVNHIPRVPYWVIRLETKVITVPTFLIHAEWK